MRYFRSIYECVNYDTEHVRRDEPVVGCAVRVGEVAANWQYAHNKQCDATRTLKLFAKIDLSKSQYERSDALPCCRQHKVSVLPVCRASQVCFIFIVHFFHEEEK